MIQPSSDYSFKYRVFVDFNINLSNMWEWLEINCPDPDSDGAFYQSEEALDGGYLGGVYFNDPNKAMHFKLMWGGR